MNLIPVIDLMQGQVVRAVRGNRQAYRPIESPLCHSSDPVAVAGILCRHCATRRLYVADLDALSGRPAQSEVLRTLLQAMPGLELWLDAGFANADAYDVSTNDVNSDIGIGLRLDLPIGPVRIDYGIPMQSDKANDSSGRFNFNIGYQF